MPNPHDAQSFGVNPNLGARPAMVCSGLFVTALAALAFLQTIGEPMKKALLVLTLASVAGLVHAEDTLKKIKDSGAVTMGVRESSGLSYTIGDGKYVGYHIDVCERVISDVRKQLGLSSLTTKYQPVTSANRIPLTVNGTVDLECGSTTNNATRQKDVAFAVTTYVEEVRIAVKANSGITNINQLNGRTVATTTGTTSVQTLRKHERATGVDFKEVFGQKHRHLQEPGRLQDRRRGAVGRAHRHHDAQGRPGLQDRRGQQHQGHDEVRRPEQGLRKVVPPAHPAHRRQDRFGALGRHQGRLGQPQRQAHGRLRKEVIRGVV
jgi:ABC-type amino acid transport substrate-binding protein